MKRFAFLLLCVCSLVAAAPAEKPVRVLFIGNSYTYYHDMPALLVKIAAAKGKRLEVEYNETCVGGYRLAQHVRRRETRTALAKPGWDFVVLQEHGSIPITGRDVMLEAVEPLAAEARARGSRVLYYITPRSCDPETKLALADRQAPITQAYQWLARKNGGSLVPVGPAFVAINQQDRTVFLFESDKIHPSSWGAYAAACTFYSVLFGESPVGAGVETFKCPVRRETLDFTTPPERQRQIEEIAWETAKPLARPGPGATAPVTAAPAREAAGAR